MIGDQDVPVSYRLKLGRAPQKGGRDLTGTVNALKLERIILASGTNRGELRLEGGMKLDVILTARSAETAIVVVVDKQA